MQQATPYRTRSARHIETQLAGNDHMAFQVDDMLCLSSMCKAIRKHDKTWLAR